jgi:hypothetical protein
MTTLALLLILVHPLVHLPAGTILKDVGRLDVVLSPAFRERPVFVARLNAYYNPEDGLTPRDWEPYPLLVGMLITVRTSEIPMDPWGPFTGNELIVGFYEKPRASDGVCPQMEGHTGYQDYPDFFSGVLCGLNWNPEIGEWEAMLVSDPDGWDGYPLSSTIASWPTAPVTPWADAALKDAAIRRMLWLRTSSSNRLGPGRAGPGWAAHGRVSG